jgi:hypothetical protein
MPPRGRWQAITPKSGKEINVMITDSHINRQSPSPHSKHKVYTFAPDDAVVEFVRRMGSVSFVELVRFLDDLGFPATGDQAIVIDALNVVLWDGVSSAFVDLMADLRNAGRLHMTPTHFLVYLMDGGFLGYPIAKRPPVGGYRKPRWLPVVFSAPAQRRRS